MKRETRDRIVFLVAISSAGFAIVGAVKLWVVFIKWAVAQ